MKRNLVIFSLISSIISFIIILLMYFGITRYVCVCTGSIDSYIEKYMENKTDKSKYKVVATIQVENENEMENAGKTIKSLLDQTKSVDKICIHTKLKDIPSDYKRAVSVYNTDENHIKSSLKREKEADTKIIAVSAGKVYSKDFIENMCIASDEEPNSVIYVKDKDGGIDFTQGCLTKPGLYGQITADFDLEKQSKIFKTKTEKAL